MGSSDGGNARIDVVAFAGSLRRRSFNRALLRAAAGLAPAHMAFDEVDISSIPVYNADFDETQGGGPYPEPVAILRARVHRADAVWMAVPEYNWGPSGVTKNVVDWLSRPIRSAPLTDKPVAIAGASQGPAGTGRAQLQLRQNLLSVNCFVLQAPVVQVGGAASRFDEGLRLTDEQTRDLLRAQLAALADWTTRMGVHRLDDLEVRIG